MTTLTTWAWWHDTPWDVWRCILNDVRCRPTFGLLWAIPPAIIVLGVALHAWWTDRTTFAPAWLLLGAAVAACAAFLYPLLWAIGAGVAIWYALVLLTNLRDAVQEGLGRVRAWHRRRRYERWERPKPIEAPGSPALAPPNPFMAEAEQEVERLLNTGV